MRRLCLGGSFNPIHYGHLRCAQGAMQALGMQRIILIPAGVSPFKTADLTLESSEHRCQMCRLAIEDQQEFEVCGIELTRPGPSYTIDTVRQLKALGWTDLHWLIGADQLPGLPNWREIDALLREVNLVILRRPGHQIDWSKLEPKYQSLRGNVVEAPLIDISATDIRRRIAAGQPIDGLTPSAVVNYIREHGLYRQSA